LAAFCAVIATIAWVLLLSAASWSGETRQHRAQSYSHGAADQAKVPTPAFTIVVQPAPVQVIQQPAPIEKRQPAQNWYQRPSATDWGILGVTFFYTLTSLGLLNATRKQAKLANHSLATLDKTLLATEKAADAAKKGADTAEKALNDLERPWIMLLPVSFALDPQAGNAGTQRRITLTWIFRNTGRSPAWITGGRGSAVKVAQASLPLEPNYPQEFEYALTPSPPNDSREEFATLNFSGAEFQALWARELDFVVYGFVNYRDSLKNEEHCTRYCFCLSGPIENAKPLLNMSFCGPPAYNKYT